MRKKFLSLILVCAVFVLFSGCTKGTSTSYNPNKETENAKPQPTEPPTLYAVNPLFENEEISCIEIYDAIEETTLQITSERKIREIISMFNNWDMESHKVPDEHILDLGLDVEITFNDNLVIRTSSSYNEPYINYYGSIGDSYYYLPQEFWEYVYGKIN